MESHTKKIMVFGGDWSKNESLNHHLVKMKVPLISWGSPVEPKRFFETAHSDKLLHVWIK
jgi:hypothetical protein